MKHQSQQENMIYLVVWGLLFAVPLLSKINTNAQAKAPCVAKNTATLPQIKLQLVIASGIIRLTFIIVYKPNR